MTPSPYVTSLVAALTAHGDAPALLAPAASGGAVTSCADLLGHAHRTARVLGDLGATRGDRIVFSGGNSERAYAVMIAAHLLGIAVVVVPPELAAAHGDHVLDLVAPVLVIGDDVAGPESPAPARGEGGERLRAAAVPEADLAARLSAADPSPVAVTAEDGDLARIMFTSGTTGDPKGVAFRFADLAAASAARAAGGRPPAGLRFVLMEPFAHAAGAMSLGLLRAGLPTVLHRAFDAAALADEVEAAAAAGGLVTAYLFPDHAVAFAEHVRRHGTDLRGLAVLTYGSSLVDPGRLASMLEVLGPRLAQSYAQTEALGIAALSPEDHARAAADPALLRRVGRPLPRVRVEVRDEAGRPVPPGTDGDVWVSGPVLLHGFWTRDGLRPRTGDWLDTGDVGRFDPDGYLELLGRRADQLVFGGRRVAPGEVEAPLRAEPTVAEAVVVAGPEPDEVTAHVVGVPGVARERLVASVQACLTRRLGPEGWHVVVAEALPRTPMDKYDRRVLRERAPAVIR